MKRISMAIRRPKMPNGQVEQEDQADQAGDRRSPK